MLILNILLLIVFPVVIFLNIFIVSYIIKSALKKFVKPQLIQKGFVFVDYKWCGFFSHGEFKDDKFKITFVSMNGNPSISIYVDIYYKDAGLEKKITIRIDTLFCFIRKVVYSAKTF
jgi:hypothetical protein